MRASSFDHHRAQRCLDQHDDVQRREVADLLRILGLGQHHGRVVGLGERVEVRRVVGGRGGVDPHDGAVGIQRRVDQRSARRFPVLRRDTVLEVEDHHIGCRRGLLEPLRPVGRAEQPAGPV